MSHEKWFGKQNKMIEGTDRGGGRGQAGKKKHWYDAPRITLNFRAKTIKI